MGNEDPFWHTDDKAEYYAYCPTCGEQGELTVRFGGSPPRSVRRNTNDIRFRCGNDNCEWRRKSVMILPLDYQYDSIGWTIETVRTYIERYDPILSQFIG
jgi:hypothetical protein